MGADLAIPGDSTPVGAEILVFDEGATRADIVAELSTRIPQNEFGLPEFIFRSDLLPSGPLADDDIDACSVGLFYHQGYPTFENGASFWNQLPHEPQSAFQLFQAYLDQAMEIGIRQLDLLAAGCDKTLDEISQLAKEFYWTARARAYDLFIVAAEAKKRQHRIRHMENKHFVDSGTLLDKLKSRFIDDFDDWIEELNAKEAIEAMETLVKIQRMSVGLTGQHASSTARDIGPGESPEAVIRKLAQGAGASRDQADSFQASLQKLLTDPEEGATIQAAILKFTAGGNRQKFEEGLGN